MACARIRLSTDGRTEYAFDFEDWDMFVLWVVKVRRDAEEERMGTGPCDVSLEGLRRRRSDVDFRFGCSESYGETLCSELMVLSNL